MEGIHGVATYEVYTNCGHEVVGEHIVLTGNMRLEGITYSKSEQ